MAAQNHFLLKMKYIIFVLVEERLRQKKERLLMII